MAWTRQTEQRTKSIWGCLARNETRIDATSFSTKHNPCSKSCGIKVRPRSSSPESRRYFLLFLLLNLGWESSKNGFSSKGTELRSQPTQYISCPFCRKWDLSSSCSSFCESTVAFHDGCQVLGQILQGVCHKRLWFQRLYSLDVMEKNAKCEYSLFGLANVCSALVLICLLGKSAAYLCSCWCPAELQKWLGLDPSRPVPKTLHFQYKGNLGPIRKTPYGDRPAGKTHKDLCLEALSCDMKLSLS